MFIFIVTKSYKGVEKKLMDFSTCEGGVTHSLITIQTNQKANQKANQKQIKKATD